MKSSKEYEPCNPATDWHPMRGWGGVERHFINLSKRVGRGVPGVVVWSLLIVLLLINVLGEIVNG